MSRVFKAAAVAAAFSGALAGCAIETGPSYTLAGGAPGDFRQIRNLAEFNREIVGKSLSNGAVRLVIRPNNVVTGSGQAGRVRLNWQWRSGYYCREGTVGSIAVTEDCEEVLISGNTALFISNRGRGTEVEYRIGG